jgi:nucleotide-binding universal stress UspA family protein
VRAALPLLKDASRVAILQHIDEIDVDAGSLADPARLTTYLAAHDVAVDRVIQTHGRNIGAALLEAADDYGAALLVAGAYGHARLREALFGGATRAFLAARNGPHLFLAH